MINKIKGAMFGLAVGDALGATTEFMIEEDVKAQYGTISDMLGGGWLDLQVGETTDDTDMTLAVAEGILESPLDPIKTIGEKFIEWYDTDPLDVGVTTRFVIEHIKKQEGKKDWNRAAEAIHNLLNKSGGNGTLMRCLPIALIYKSKPQVFNVSMRQSMMTHYDDLATEACLLYNSIAYDILNRDMDLKQAITTHIANTSYDTYLHSDPTAEPDGFVVNTFAWVIRALMTTDSYEEAVLKLVNKGGDADTTAAIAGGLAGLHYGYEAIPSKWIEQIDKKERIEAASIQIFLTRG